MKEASEIFREVIEKFDTAILATVNGAGEIHARPMAIFDFEEEGNIVFITDENSAKVHEIQNDPRATVICQEGWTRTVTLTGRASLFRDAAKLREKWRKTFQAWFEGPDDPRIVLVRVFGETGEYWDNSGTKGVQYMFRAAKAALGGGRPRIEEPEQHDRVTLRNPN